MSCDLFSYYFKLQHFTYNNCNFMLELWYFRVLAYIPAKKAHMTKLNLVGEQIIDSFFNIYLRIYMSVYVTF